MADVATPILRRSLDKIAQEHNYTDPDYKITTVSTEGANFTSILFAATISSQKKDDLSLFAKVAAAGEAMRSQAPMRVFDIEATFYTKLQEEYRQLEDKHGVPEQHRFKTPKAYACSTTLYEETFVLENLTTKGYQLQDRFQSVDWEYAAASFTELAKMHALSIALKHENPEGFEKYLEWFKFQWNESGDGAEMKAAMEGMMKRVLDVTREDNKEKIMALLGKIMSEGGIESFLKYYMPGDSPVLRHGDFRPSNLMHKVNEDGSLDIVVVDFQTIQPGTPVIDLLYFIFLSTDQEFRGKYFDQLIDHYYTELSAAVSRLGLDPEDTYSRQKFDDDMKENLSYGLMVALTVLPLVTVNVADAPRASDQTDVSCFQTMKYSSVFEERLNGIFDDFVKWELL